MKTRSVVTTTAVLAGATALGIAAGSATFALWKTDDTLLSFATTGQFSAQVQDGDGGGQPATWAAANHSDITFGLNAAAGGGSRPQGNPLLALDTNAPQAYPIKVDTSAWGRYDIDFSLTKLTARYTGSGTADPALVDNVNVVISSVADAASCTTSFVPTTSAKLYSGALGNIAANTTQGVYGKPSPELSDSDVFCLQFTLPGGPQKHSNTVTVEGTGTTGVKVKDSDTWTGNVDFSAEARNYALDLTVVPTLNRATP